MLLSLCSSERHPWQALVQDQYNQAGKDAQISDPKCASGYSGWQRIQRKTIFWRTLFHVTMLLTLSIPSADLAKLFYIDSYIVKFAFCTWICLSAAVRTWCKLSTKPVRYLFMGKSRWDGRLLPFASIHTVWVWSGGSASLAYPRVCLHVAVPPKSRAAALSQGRRDDLQGGPRGQLITLLHSNNNCVRTPLKSMILCRRLQWHVQNPPTRSPHH